MAAWMIDPFVLIRPEGPAVPLVISSPHGGGHYPEGARQQLGVHRDVLAALSDGPVHELFLPAVLDGAALIRALWSRAWIDLNRDPADLDAEAIIGVPGPCAVRRSMRVRAGLGVVPTRLGERRIHQRRLSYREVAARIQAVHVPYHAALAGECQRLVAAFGRVLLLDCHSMPGSDTSSPGIPEIALGDRFGQSCALELVRHAEEIFRAAGFSVARNQPFAGGWITERHGRPARHVHALQIEIRRDLFHVGRGLDPAGARLQAVARELVLQLGARLGGTAQRPLHAAE